MKTIRTVSKLQSFFMQNKAILVYGAGFVSRTILDLMKKKNLLRNIYGVAVESLYDNPHYIANIPVLPIRNLVHFSREASVLILTRENLQGDIKKVVSQYGFFNVWVLTEDCIEEAVQLNRLENDEKNTLVDIMKKLEDIQFSIYEQNEICAVHMKTFAQYKNCNRGKEVVVVGTGSTLNKYIPIKSALHVGVNNAYRRQDIAWDYYFAQDFDRRGNGPVEALENTECPFFLGRFPLSHRLKSVEAPAHYELKRENIYRYFVDTWSNKIFHLDLSFHPLVEYGSVIFPALQFVLYTNPSKIYLVGCDTTLQEHFYDLDDKSPHKESDWLPLWWKTGYAAMKTFADLYYPETEIISINPVGLMNVFTDIYV